MRSLLWGIVRPPLVTEFLPSCCGGGNAESISASGVATWTLGVAGGGCEIVAAACWGVGLRGGVCMRLRFGFVFEFGAVETVAAPFRYDCCESYPVVWDWFPV